MTQSSKQNSCLLAAVAIAPPSIDDWSEIGKLAGLMLRDLEPFVHARTPSDILRRSQSAPHTLVARLEARIVAALSWQLVPSAANTSARLLGIRVDPLFRGLGIARLLIARMELATATSASEVVASTDLATADFLRHHGYEFKGYERGKSTAGHREPVFHVAKALPQPSSARVQISQPLKDAPTNSCGAATGRSARDSSTDRAVTLAVKSLRSGTRRSAAKPLH